MPVFRLFLLVCIGFLPLSAASPYEENRSGITKDFDQRMTVFAEEIPLYPDRPAQTRLGPLTYVRGWALTSDHHQFGGFSSLHIDGGRLLSLSDQGLWMQAAFDPDNRAQPLDGATLTWQTPRNKRFKGQHSTDAESIVPFGGGYLVAYEKIHRIEQTTAPGAWSFITALSEKIDFGGIPRNGGIEAMAWAGPDRLLAISERGKNTKGELRGWLLADGGVAPVWFRPPTNFSPTDAATLPGGDILVLLRRFSLLEGVGAKIVRIPRDSISPGAHLTGEEIASIEAPANVDNMEGIDVVEKDGRLFIHLISDDNMRSFQRTLLMIFEYGDNEEEVADAP